MTTDAGLAIILRSQSEHLATLRAQAQDDLAAARRTSDRLDALARDLGGEHPAADGTNEGSRAVRRTSRPDAGASPGSLRDQAAAHLLTLGIDPGSTTFDDLLDLDEIARIERRVDADFAIHARLDAYDVLAVVAAGLAASLLDLLLVGIPQETTWWGGGGRIHPSPLTARLKELEIDRKGTLARRSKVPFDRIYQGIPERIDGLHPRSHRVQTPGHDPLFGLLIGVADIIRGTMTVIPRGGGIKVLDIGAGESNPFKALALELGHLVSDVGTEMGIPAPGWTALVSLGGPAFGPPVKGGPIGRPDAPENIGEIARRMYLNGYDSRHFVSMTSSAAAVDVILRGYWGLRGAVDPDWREVIDGDADRHGSTCVSDHPRFASMSLGAHGIAATGDLVKLALAGGNPLALNYAEWLTFLRAFFRWADDRQISVGARIDRGMRANARAVEAGWMRLDFTDPEFTRLVPTIGPPPSLPHDADLL